MSATASRIALSAPESVSVGTNDHTDPNALPEPPSPTTEGSRTLPPRDHGGRFAPRATFPCCDACGWTLAETLAGGTYCPATRCAKYREVVGTVPGVDPGTVTAEALAVRT